MSTDTMLRYARRLGGQTAGLLTPTQRERGLAAAEALYVADEISLAEFEQHVESILVGFRPGLGGRGGSKIADAIDRFELRGSVDCIVITVRL
jgi:hypothetical protein